MIDKHDPQLRARTMNTLRRATVRLASLALAGAVLLSASRARGQNVIYGPIRNPANGHIYYVLSPAKYGAAERKAIDMGGYMVKIDDEDENRWVDYTFAAYQTLRSDYWYFRWIGATARYDTSTWLTYDGQPAAVETNKWWASGEPDGVNENCVALWTTDGDPAATCVSEDCSRWQYYAIVELEDCNYDFQPDSLGAKSGLWGFYIANAGTPDETVCHQRRDPVINFNWSSTIDDDPPPSCLSASINPWRVVWRGCLRSPKSEHFTFYLTSGPVGHSRLVLRDSLTRGVPEGEAFVNLYCPGDGETSAVTVPLTQGVSYSVQLRTGWEKLKQIRLEWASPTTQRQVIPPSAWVDCHGDSYDVDSPCWDPAAGYRIGDCNGNIVSDECDISSGASADCNGNGKPDECEIASSGPGSGRFPTVLVGNTTGAPNSKFTGPPDDSYAGIFDHSVTYDFGDLPVTDLPGPDFNVYEVDGGTPEFGWIVVFASADGTSFCDVTGSEGPVLRVPGDERHGDDEFARSYDISACGLTAARYVRVLGKPGYQDNGFDLDAIGAPGFLRDCNNNGTFDSCDIDSGVSRDCDRNGIPDECQTGAQADCNGNGRPDGCDIEDGLERDCNGNNIPDSCDVDPDDPDGDTIVHDDCNQNGVPDECDSTPPPPVVSSFDDWSGGTEGWALTGEGQLQRDTPDVSPGYLVITDTGTTPDGDLILSAPANFLGNLSAYNGGTLRFDTNIIFGAGSPRMDFGTVTIYGPAGKIASRDMVPGDPAADPIVSTCPNPCAPDNAADGWRRWSMSLTARNWGVGGGTWNTILSNVTAITIKVDAQDGGGEAIGFDNVTISFLPDCNCNGTPDGCEIQTDPSMDCNANGILDACEVLVTGDCNGDCTLDVCQIAVEQGGFCVENPETPELECPLHDCNVAGEQGYGVPDECEIPVSQGGLCDYEPYCPATDCQPNGIPDTCDIRRGIEQDCDLSSVPDFCEIRDGILQDWNTNGVPDDCELAGGDCNDDGWLDAWQVTLDPLDSAYLADCNMDGIADVCAVDELERLITGAASRNFFQVNRQVKGTTYQDMIAAYGRPWKPGYGQQPALLPGDDPASKYRALLGMRICQDAMTLVGPVLPELFAFEMALGNEAFADAADRTIGLSGISPAELGDLFAFQGVPGVGSLLDEELALLRGRALAGNPEDWLEDNDYYPVFTDAESKMTRAAIYNRLPPNAGGSAGSAAYISNYGPGINNNYDAAVRYPQGHGDAYGYYLQAAKAYLETFRGKPDDPADAESLLAQQLIDAQPTDFEQVTSGRVGLVDMPYQSVRNMVRAMTARAGTALRVVEKTYRRDYCEDPEDPRALHMLSDEDPERAWGMADWARRAGMGAYLDWAVANQLLPASPTPQLPDWGERTDPPQPESWIDPLTGVCTDGVPVEQWDAWVANGGFSLGPGNTCADLPADCPLVHRANVDEVFQLAGAVSEMQQQVDQAGAGLSPLGLLPNAVPFGINAGELGTASGRSHYEQVRDAAVNALNNAQAVLGYANQGTQRLREQGEAQQTFAEQVEDTEADFNNRLIELFGYPSPDDPADNDFDPTTTDPDEAESAPDLVNYLLDEQELNKQNFRPRLAPGEIQLAMAEVKLAGKRVEEAQTALKDLAAEIKDLQDFRRFLARKGEDTESIYDKYGNKLDEDVQKILDKDDTYVEGLKGAGRASKIAAAGVLGFFGMYGGDWGDGGESQKPAPAYKGGWGGKGKGMGKLAGAAGALGGALDASADTMLACAADKEEETKFKAEREIERINVWKDVQLKQLDIDIQYEEQFLRLQSLFRQEPQFILNGEIAKDNLTQALGRLNAAVERGRRLVAERYRVQKVQRDQLQQYRWEDLAYRTFRNNALGKYDAFFDLAARYVMLAGRAYAYEYNSRAQADAILERIHRERMLGDPGGLTGGLQGIITDLDNLAVVNNFNTPLTTVGQRSFSLRGHMLGLRAGTAEDASFRSFLERHIVQNLQEDPAMQDFAQLSTDVHYGPAIVVPFFSEVAGKNFFGFGPKAPFGNTNFPVSLNTKIRNFAIRLVGADCDALGIDPQNPYVWAFLMPIGQSILRENTNAATVEENLPRAWAVVDQWLPAPPLVSVASPAVQDRSYNPWVSLAGSGGNYLNAVKRFRETEAEVELGQPLTFKTELAGRGVWNTRWLLVIPGRQWAGSSNLTEIREQLLTLIYGPMQQENSEGMTDIRIIIQAYAH